MEEVCRQLSDALGRFDAPCGVAIVQSQRKEVTVDLVSMSAESPASYVPAMQSEDLALLDIQRIQAIKLETFGTQGQLTHPKAISSELQKIDDAIVRFKSDKQALDVLDAMARAVAWAVDNGSAWAGVAARRKDPDAESELEVKPICSLTKEMLDVEFAAIGSEWMKFPYQIRIDHG